MSREGFHPRRNTSEVIQAFFKWRLGDADVTPTEAVIDSATGVVLDAVLTVEALEWTTSCLLKPPGGEPSIRKGTQLTSLDSMRQKGGGVGEGVQKP